MNIKSLQGLRKQTRKEQLFSRSNTLFHAFHQNQQLLNVLNQKMFKGYRQIKKTSNPSFNIKRFMKNLPANYYPGNENYNIYYKEKYLSPLASKFNFYDTTIIVDKQPRKKTPNHSRHSQEQPLFLTHNPEKGHLKENYSIWKNLIQDGDNKNCSDYQFIMIEKRDDLYDSNYQSRKKRDCLNKNSVVDYNKKLTNKEKFSFSQSEFLYKLSHKKNHSANIMNFKTNKGLFHAKTMTNIFMSDPNNQKKFKNEYKRDLLFQNPRQIQLEIVRKTREDPSKMYLAKKYELIKKGLENFHNTVGCFSDTLDKEINDDDSVSSENQKILKNSYKNEMRKSESAQTTKEEKINLKKKCNFKSTVFGLKKNATNKRNNSNILTPREETKNRRKSPKEISAFLKDKSDSNFIKSIFSKGNSHSQIHCTIDPKSNLLKSSKPSNLAVFYKQLEAKDRQIAKILSRNFTKEEVEDMTSLKYKRTFSK